MTQPTRTRRLRVLPVLLALVAIALATGPAPIRAVTAPPPLQAAAASHRLTHEVYAYLPYWELDASSDSEIRYDLVTTISLFSFHYAADGTILQPSAYATLTGPLAQAIVAHAHAVGVRIEVAFGFSATASVNEEFFANSVAQATAIAQTVDLVTMLGADGVNLDVEALGGASFPAYGAFAGGMKTALTAHNPAARVSVATNGGKSGARMADAALLAGADRAFLMGYSYRTAGTSPTGSVSPIIRTDGGLSLSASLGLYAAEGVSMDRVILGLPTFGRTWATVDDQLHSARNLGLSPPPGVTACAWNTDYPVFFPREMASVPAGTTMQYDPLEEFAWFASYDNAAGTWCQTYFDDPHSLAAKYEFAKAESVAGVGIWALGYADGQPGYWEAVADAFTGATYVTVGPSRFIDTRTGIGLAGAFTANVARTIQVTGHGGVPASAIAVTGTLTIVAPTKPGFASLTPIPVALPTTSNLNFPAGDTRATGFTAPLGPTGSLSAIYRASSGSAHVVLDVTGYFVTGDAGATYVPVGPSRFIDTRTGIGLAGAFTANVARTIQVTGHGGVPASAIAVTGTLTIVAPTKPGFASLTPIPVALPTTSNLNFPAGDTRATGFTAPLGPTGSLSAIYRASSGSAHVVLDVTGYFVTGDAGATYVPVGPSRFIDTRTGIGLAGAFTANVARTIQVTGHGGVPASAIAVTGTLTIVAPTKPGFASLTPIPVALPTTSNLNFPAGDTRATGFTAPLGPTGSLSAIYRASSGSAHVVLDVTGYFAR